MRIEAKRVQDLLRLEVEDNGPGVTSSADAVEKHRLGLSNVRARLSQLYGTAASLEMSNGSAGGLTVVIKLPFEIDSSAVL